MRSRRTGSCVIRSRARRGSSDCSPALPDADPELRADALRALGGALDIFGEPNGPRPATGRASSSSSRSVTSSRPRTSRYRVAANMVMGGDAAAWPLLEEALVRARELGLRRRGQALGFLAAEGVRTTATRQLAIERSLESAAIARESRLDVVGGRPARASVATIERERGDLDAAEAHARTALELALGLGDGRHSVFAAAELAVLAAARGDASAGGTALGRGRDRGEDRTHRPVGTGETGSARSRASRRRPDIRQRVCRRAADVPRTSRRPLDLEESRPNARDLTRGKALPPPPLGRTRQEHC